MSNKPESHAEILVKMKQEYAANVAWAHGKTQRVPEGYTWAVQTKVISVSEMGIGSMQARIIIKGVHRDRAASDWISLDTPGELRRQIARAVDRVIKLPLRDFDPVINVALTQGREILKKLGAHVSVCKFNENYLQVWLPERNYPHELETILQFDLWKNKEPARRKWRSKLNRDALYASGYYAWNIALDLRTEQACIYYANCILHKSKSDWFPWDDLHDKLWEQINRAEAGNWRDSELYLQQKENRDIAKDELKERIAILNSNDKYDRIQIDLLKAEFEQLHGYGEPSEPVAKPLIDLTPQQLEMQAKQRLIMPRPEKPKDVAHHKTPAELAAELKARADEKNDPDYDPSQPTGGISFDVMDKKIHD